jgi:hypothetical protein
MIYPELFNDLKKEFPENIALGVCVAVGIHLSTKPKKKDLEVEGGFEKRVEKKIRKTLWENTEKDLIYIVRLWKCVHFWMIQRSLGGNGVCEKKTFIKMLSEQK